MRQARSSRRIGYLLAAVLTTALVGCGGGGGAGLPAGGAPAGELPAPALQPDGEEPPAIAESTESPDRSSPAATLRSIFVGRARADLAYLARCDARTAGKATLDKVDAADAHLDYAREAVAPFWSRIEAALEGGRVEFSEDGDTALAKASFDAASAVASTTLRFEKIGGDWYLRMGGQ